jgi:hypothetical protein
MTNLLESGAGHEKVAVVRKMPLDVLTGSLGSLEVERAYLANFRKWLEELVQGTSAQSLTAGS